MRDKVYMITGYTKDDLINQVVQIRTLNESHLSDDDKELVASVLVDIALEENPIARPTDVNKSELWNMDSTQPQYTYGNEHLPFTIEISKFLIDFISKLGVEFIVSMRQVDWER